MRPAIKSPGDCAKFPFSRLSCNDGNRSGDSRSDGSGGWGHGGGHRGASGQRRVAGAAARHRRRRTPRPKDAPPGERRKRSAVALAGLEGVRKAKPAAFFSPRFETMVTPGNLEDDLAEAAAKSDVIIEAVIENLAIKQKLYARLDELRRAGHRHLQHLGAADRRADAGAQRRLPRAVLHHPLLQPAPLPQAGRDRRRRRHRPRDAGARRGAVRRAARQGAGPRQGHAQLHRQPDRDLRAHADARRGGRSRATPSRRSTPCSARPPGGPRAPCSAPPTWWASTRWCTSPATAPTRSPTTSGARCSSRRRC